MLVELEDLKKYLNVNFNDDDNLIMNIACEELDYIKEVIGSSYFMDSIKYKTSNNIAKILLKKLVFNNYENRNSYSGSKYIIDTTQHLWNILIMNKPLEENYTNE